jgi:hypothetical protein
MDGLLSLEFEENSAFNTKRQEISVSSFFMVY